MTPECKALLHGFWISWCHHSFPFYNQKKIVVVTDLQEAHGILPHHQDQTFLDFMQFFLRSLQHVCPPWMKNPGSTSGWMRFYCSMNQILMFLFLNPLPTTPPPTFQLNRIVLPEGFNLSRQLILSGQSTHTHTDWRIVHWRIQRGVRDARSLSNFFHFHVVFGKNLAK